LSNFNFDIADILLPLYDNVNKCGVKTQL